MQSHHSIPIAVQNDSQHGSRPAEVSSHVNPCDIVGGKESGVSGPWLIPRGSGSGHGREHSSEGLLLQPAGVHRLRKTPGKMHKVGKLTGEKVQTTCARSAPAGKACTTFHCFLLVTFVR